MVPETHILLKHRLRALAKHIGALMKALQPRSAWQKAITLPLATKLCIGRCVLHIIQWIRAAAVKACGIAVYSLSTSSIMTRVNCTLVVEASICSAMLVIARLGDVAVVIFAG